MLRRSGRVRSCVRPVDAVSTPLALMVSADRLPITSPRFCAMVLAGASAENHARYDNLVLGTIGNFVQRLGMIGAKEPLHAATQGTDYTRRCA
jgi:hypothetical protein